MKAVAPNRPKRPAKPTKVVYPDYDATFRPEDAIVAEGPAVLQPSKLAYRDDARGLWLYHGDCLEVMDTLRAKYPHGVFDLIFADPPYFLSNGGITCQNGRMVKVDKGDWDKSRGPEENHNFNREWLRRCQALLKPNGTLWVSGTHHVIFSVGYAMQQLGMKMLNQVTWQKPNPPPNLACRYFTHSTETILWAAKNEQSRHRFNYADMKRANGNKQMKDVWAFTAPKPDEKLLGKHPTQKPVALLERIILSSTTPGDLVLDPFMGSGTTGLAALNSARRFVGLDAEARWVQLAEKRLRAEPIPTFFVSIGGGALCADHPLRSLEIASPIHWAGSTAAGGEARSARLREREKEQGLGGVSARKMHQHRPQQPISAEWPRLGIENHLARAA
ncbi:MAG: site-specific DNA-methyltransferase [Lacunisphaera sp.]|nr:site-specific DNA-methyltransferase [Lacunisphaera sp.]